MENTEKQSETEISEMHKRRETMPDGERYIIYYTFGEAKAKPTKEDKENV